MDVLIGTDRDANGFVALIDGTTTLRAGNLQELANRLHALGVDEQNVRLAGPDDGDHALSFNQHVSFNAAWKIAVAASTKR